MTAALRAWWIELPGNLRGALWLLMATTFFSVMGALVKALGDDFDSPQMVFFRCSFGLLVLLPFVIRQGGPRVYVTRRFGMHLLRSLFGLTAMTCMFFSITRLPFADAVALTFTKPLFMIVLAVLFLGETVRWRRWTATAVGFGGVLIMLRPGAGTFEPASLVALLGACFIAGVMVVIKKMSPTERPVTILAYFGTLSTLASLGPALWVWRAPDAAQLVLLLGIGAAGTLGQFLIIRAYAVAEATAVAPFDYARLLFAGLIGFAVFDEVPDAWTLTGAAVIVASTLYIARREARRPDPLARAADAA
jgi:drug/metabolite transporter (DMT)-like permease